MTITFCNKKPKKQTKTSINLSEKHFFDIKYQKQRINLLRCVFMTKNDIYIESDPF